MRKLLLIAFLLSSPFVQAAEVPTRIVSVGGALTEMLYALGESARIVGADTTSYYPLAAKELPKVGYQRNLSAEGILSLKPDLLLINE
ncbi:MAG: ABC transporter substrate-binding protein, partial [Sneathiella sp.]|nr:ABC transporter substrate-binding protein [Sneathiella sp.]